MFYQEIKVRVSLGTDKRVVIDVKRTIPFLRPSLSCQRTSAVDRWLCEKLPYFKNPFIQHYFTEINGANGVTIKPI